MGEALEGKFAELQQQLNDIGRYFGENPQTFVPQEFFCCISTFCQDFDGARAKQEQQRASQPPTPERPQ
eukprot:NODE_1632_length_920_cov_160.526980_g1144_i0.p6 GENE.NODE_1632_length_920_cov_160.526980_g1144_i0~~NODE_1632_length_920_cov_160.526980_g1144_i0.p6  ORF type:complete len:69 (+),score=28.29 NODE_1632_length_920_cov_160.526980_g1144_i0:30-236(+)